MRRKTGRTSAGTCPELHNGSSGLQEANRNPLEVMDTDLIAEEMAARSGVLNAYQWVDDELTAMYDSPIGLSVM